MQHHDNRRALGRRAGHAVFKMRGADGEEARGGKGGHVSSFPKVIQTSHPQLSSRPHAQLRIRSRDDERITMHHPAT
jgi:hypothetical protein